MSLERFVAAAPQPQRAVLRVLVALQRRDGGRRLLRRAAPLDQLAHGLLAMAHWDEPTNARALGWDADAVVARGRALRQEEDRP